MSRKLPPSQRPERQPDDGPAPLHRYEVGKPYVPGKTRWPEAVEYNFRCGAHELRMFYPRPTPKEVEAVRTGPAEFALYVDPPLIQLCYRFGPAPWSDCPYTVHRVNPADRRDLPPWEETSPELRALLNVVLVDADTGLIRALRALPFSPEFTRVLHRSIAEQEQAPWDPGAYDAALQHLYRSQSSDTLAKQARVRCRGGD